MKQLLVFIGKPGAGKTTLMTELFPELPILDVADFIYSHMKDGRWPEHKTFEGYEEMYTALECQDGLTLLELGTNHAQYNIDQLARLKKDWDIRLFVCTASVDTMRHRVENRPGYTDMESIEARWKRDFPNSHLPLFEQIGIEPYFLDMEQPMSDNVILVRQALRS